MYLAHDQRHDRPVAVKVLSEQLAATIGVERFLAEIKTTARLQHPNILTLIDSGEAAGRLYYVMPYAAGESLRDLLRRETQLPIEDAVRIAREVADALGHAHAVGIVHRDIKPENILLQGGHALVADFGIALAMQQASGGRLTQTGLSVGTPQYMSPEQAMGEKTIDARADVYALGAMTYEMLTGEPPFTGATLQAVVAKLMASEPVRPTDVRRTIPAHVETAVLRALAKLPADRFSSVGQFAADLMTGPSGGIASRPIVSEGKERSTPWLRDRRTIGVLGVAALLLLLVGLYPRTPDASVNTVRLTIAPPTGTQFDVVNWASAAVTPDGKRVVFAARGAKGSMLYVRSLDDFEARPLLGTEGAAPAVAISPDGQWVAFRTSRMDVRKVALSGNVSAVSLGGVQDWFGQTTPIWLGDSLVVMVHPRAAWAFSANGATTRRFASVDSAQGERAFNSAIALPGGRLLVAVETDSVLRAVIIEPDGKHRSVRGAVGTLHAFVAPDRIVMEKDGRLRVVRLDVAALSANDEPITILPSTVTMRSAISERGDVVYFQLQRGRGRRLVWVDRRGGLTPLAVEPGEYRSPRLSHDGRRAVMFGRTETELVGTTVIDLESGGRISLTSLSYSANPLWDRTGNDVLVAAGIAVPQQIYRQSADGTGKPTVAFQTDVRSAAYSVTEDGGVLLEALGQSVDILLAKANGESRVVIGGSAAQRLPMLSPDGKWLAYQASDNDRYEIYVQPWPALDRKWAISTEGGTEPVWSRDGRELYFRSGSTMMMSRISTSPEFSVTRPLALFDASRYSADPMGDPSYDVGPNGRFLMVEDDPGARVELRVERRALRRGGK